jgi:hypothetical protein
VLENKGENMFNKNTLKSKTFWVGLGSIAAGAFLCYQGGTDQGITLIGGGLVAVTGSDRLTKVLEVLREKQAP